MSGHSKWSSIKHRKAAADAKRGQLFTKLARAITVAAREGGGDPEANYTLGAAIERATYEGYGPAGVAVLVEALTDNRNRTSAEVRHAFDKNGGSLGEPGSVAWQFESKGVIMVDGGRYSEDDLIAAIDAGAEDVVADGDSLKVVSTAQDLAAVRSALAVMRLMDTLDDHDDVDSVHANFDIPEAILEEVEAAA